MFLIKRIKYHLALLVAFTFLLFTAHTQVNSLYLMHRVPQTVQMNPAVGYYCKSFLELPVISGIMVNTGTNIASYKDIIAYRDSENSYYIDYENLRQKAGINNRIYISNEINILGGGMELSGNYLSANIGLKTYVSFGAPKDLFLATDGNWDLQRNEPRDLKLSNTFLKATSFVSISGAFSTLFTNYLRVGGRIKYLQGAFNSTTRKSILTLDTEDNPIILDIDSEVVLRNSFPMEVMYHANGSVSEINLDNSFTNIPGDFLFNKNRGVALDAGVIYDYTDKLQLSASITDVGFIRWKSNINNLTEEGQFTFSGFDLSGYTGNTDDVDLLESLSDSIQENFIYNQTQDPYFALLPMRFYGAARYQLREKLFGGATFRADIHDLNIYPSLTLSMIYKPNQAISGLVSYTFMNRSFNNVGAGIVAGNNIVQFYFISDVIPFRYAQDNGSGLILPYSSRAINFHFGINLVFHCQDDSKTYRKGSYNKLCPAYN